MKVAALVLLVAGAAALAFGAWGRFTAGGRARFDEMAGILPYAAFYGSFLLLGASAACALVAARSSG